MSNPWGSSSLSRRDRRGVRFRRLATLSVVLAAGTLSVTASTASATWSVVGVDPETNEVGVAVASCVGFEVTSVPILVPGVGAGASQADISSESGQRFVEAMTGDATAQEVIDAVVAADDAPDDRQFGVVVLSDSGAGWTGADTLDVAIDRRSPDGRVAAQGNILTDAAVVDAALAAYEASDGQLADRLLAALIAGADAGGDRRCGDQTATAAALIVARPGDANYAQTDASIFGVDPESVDVPSVFVSVLVERDTDRAPDRLAAAWAEVDQTSDRVLVRQIDDGADTAVNRARMITFIVMAIVIVGAIALIVTAVRRRRRD